MLHVSFVNVNNYPNYNYLLFSNVSHYFYSSFLLTFIDAITCALMCIFTINAALMITFGFMTWCNDMIERFPS